MPGSEGRPKTTQTDGPTVMSVFVSVYPTSGFNKDLNATSCL